MTPAETITILRQFNEWRLSDEDLTQLDPKQITEAIDAAIEMIDSMAVAIDSPHGQPTPSVPEPLTVSQAPHSQYAKGWNDCIKAMAEAKP